MCHLWFYYSKWQHCFNSVFLTRFAVFSGESFHADTLVSIFLVQRNAFSSVLTGWTVTRRLQKAKDKVVSKIHFIAKSKYPVTWRITFIHIRKMLNLRQIQRLTFVDQAEPHVLVACRINTIIPPARCSGYRLAIIISYGSHKCIVKTHTKYRWIFRTLFCYYKWEKTIQGTSTFQSSKTVISHICV